MRSHAYHAEKLGLTIIAVADLAIVREGKADTFRYVRKDISRAISKARLKQIEALVLPPNWQCVRIAPSAKSHIQAVGTDAAGRLQYRYHDVWNEVRSRIKAERLKMFGRALPKIRAAVEADIAGRGLGRRQVLATAVRLIDAKNIRPGNERYARNGTRGASTLKPSHLDIDNSGLVDVHYTGKSGKKIELSIEDRVLRRRLARLKQANRKRLFRYRDRAGGKRNATSTDINAYLRGVSDAAVSAKDFRTFAASALALQELCGAVARDDASSKAVSQTMKVVSKHLRNTPAVARSSYVHPPIVAAFEGGDLDVAYMKGRCRDRLDKAETALMRFLEDRT